jgi:hypothetical protein
VEIINLKIDQIKKYEKNARTHSKEQIEQLKVSIIKFGFNNPLLVDSDYELIAGHGRLEAARELDFKELPSIVLGHLTLEQKKAYIIADNKIAMNSGWDYDLLISELKELEEGDDLLDSLGFDDDELNSLLSDTFTVSEHERSRNGEGDLEEEEENSEEGSYTRKVEAPIYEPKGEKPEPIELFSLDKTRELIKEISVAEIDSDIKDFLIHSAGRHTVFDYGKIAEYYSHAPKEVQELMEKSALVIIDFNKAIENGFVKLTEELKEAYKDEKNQR